MEVDERAASRAGHRVHADGVLLRLGMVAESGPEAITAPWEVLLCARTPGPPYPHETSNF